MNNFCCRHCKAPLLQKVLDLGYAPPSNSYVPLEKLNKPELNFPLRLRVCDKCFLVQTEDFTDAELLFDAEYAYFSSTSVSWLKHAKTFANDIINRLDLSSDSHVLEIASNDGYMLRNFHELGIPCLGIEPTDSTATAAESLGITVKRAFFGTEIATGLAASGTLSDLVIANNVLAHVPDLNDFCEGLAKVLKPEGVVTIEVPHVVNLVNYCQFDTVYHEHFSYFSAITIRNILSKFGLRVFDIEEIGTHGGSLRLFVCRLAAKYKRSEDCKRVEEGEMRLGIQSLSFYSDFQSRSEAIKNNFLRFLLDAKHEGKSVAAYGAAAKGNTLLNFAGVRPDLVSCVFDAAPSKQGKFLPGSHIPILSPDKLYSSNFDYIIILPWNLRDEISSLLRKSVKNKTQFVTAVPEIEIFQ